MTQRRKRKPSTQTALEDKEKAIVPKKPVAKVSPTKKVVRKVQYIKKIEVCEPSSKFINLLFRWLEVSIVRICCF
jgi:hypothetical protein